MDSEITIALIGVGATIVGTVLGWGLNNFSNRGNLNIYISSWKDEFQKNDAGEINSAKKRSEVEYYQFNASLDIYNSSGETRIMREVEIAYYYDRTLLKTLIPLDDATRKGTNQCIPVHFDELGVLNIPPKSVVSISIHKGMWDIGGKEGTLNFLWKTNNIKIRYRNEKNKIKIKKINNVDYSNHFISQNTEEVTNG